MIDPVIFQFKLLGLDIVLRWYGVLVMIGAVVGTLIAEREIRRRGENGESIWDALIWVLPVGILGARLWYVVNNILGGSSYYTDNPGKILNIPEGGLHFFGGLLFGAIALLIYLMRTGKDIWLFLDAIAPAVFIGQALARPANFINQELYGPPTKLPWGISIEASHRLPQYSDLSQFPVEATRFHPTFAYEMILNILLALLLIWISRQYAEKMKPGTIFSGWLLSAGLARAFIEFFRPDQPRIGDSFMTYSMLVSLLMAVAGAVMLLVRYGKLQFAFAEGWEDDYQIAPKQTEQPRAKTASKPSARKTTAVVDDDELELDLPNALRTRPVKKETPQEPAVKAKASAGVKKPAKTKKTAEKK
ncbi:MAG: prolipoprotein diacylglyceryl transferase [Chloroflexi bacterium]|nr:prolipoprotein diacylglyceryl transferase [Chloroflexota bacterium]